MNFGCCIDLLTICFARQVSESAKHANKEADSQKKMCGKKMLCSPVWIKGPAKEERLPAVMLLPCEFPLKKDQKIIILSIFMNMNINTIHIHAVWLGKRA